MNVTRFFFYFQQHRRSKSESSNILQIFEGMGSELWQDRSYVRINESWSMKNSKMSETIFKEMTESANLIYF